MDGTKVPEDGCERGAVVAESRSATQMMVAVGADDGGACTTCVDRGSEHGAPYKLSRKNLPEDVQRQLWKEQRRQKKERRQEAQSQRKMAQQQHWESLSPEEQSLMRQRAIVAHDARRRVEAEDDEASRRSLESPDTPTIVYDLSFTYCMTPADCRSTVAQLKLSHSILRRHRFPIRPVITSASGELAPGVQGCPAEAAAPLDAASLTALEALRGYAGFRRYPLPLHPQHWSEVFPLDRVIFLTADTDSVLSELEAGAVYVVGAFVDHNRKKGLSRDVALRYGVRMARLPLVESLTVGNICKVLTINHVTEVLCRFASTKDWVEAFKALPTRRQGNEGKRSRRQRLGTSHSSATETLGSAVDEEEGEVPDVEGGEDMAPDPADGLEGGSGGGDNTCV